MPKKQNKSKAFKIRSALCFSALVAVSPFLLSCAQVVAPAARHANIPSPAIAEERQQAVNEKPDSVLYLPLGSDVLVPEAATGVELPNEFVGPFELRGETLAGALQLILAEYEIPLAFESNEGLTRTITVANLQGPLDKVVDRVCSLADLYCAYEDGLMTIKDTQTFSVTIPPVGGDTDILGALSSGLQAITGSAPIVDQGTRTIIYSATNRTSKLAERYFQRIRSNTALIVFEVYIWEVALNSSNATGIDWEKIDVLGKFATGISIPGAAVSDFSPISIGLPTTGDVAFGSDDVLQFISGYGAVKTISQPQITVLSGAEATLRAADTINYVSSLTRSVDEGEVTVSTETDSVDTGFDLTIACAWDNSTIYGNIDIDLQEFRRFQNFQTDNGNVLQLPETTERELSTQVRIRPGDSLLIAGLVRENDQFDSSGPGFNEPIFPTSRSARVSNTELVFLLRPRVIIYTDEQGGTISSVKKPLQKTRGYVSDKSTLGYPEPVRFPIGTVPTDLLNPSGTP